MEIVIKKPKLGKIKTGVKCNLYEARSLAQQMFDGKAVFELQESLKEKNPKIPLVHSLHSSISADKWCNTKFGEVPIFSPQAYQGSKLGNHSILVLTTNLKQMQPLLLTSLTLTFLIKVSLSIIIMTFQLWATPNKQCWIKSESQKKRLLFYDKQLSHNHKIDCGLMNGN